MDEQRVREIVKEELDKIFRENVSSAIEQLKRMGLQKDYFNQSFMKPQLEKSST